MQPETMDFKEKWSEYVICPHTDPERIEWTSKIRSATIPYGLMVRTFPKDDPPATGFQARGMRK